jgi:hypothetical protein
VKSRVVLDCSKRDWAVGYLNPSSITMSESTSDTAA